MSRIHSENTKVENIVFRELRKKKIYFKKYYSKVEGKPDIALPRKKKAIFIDGDFWHGYQIESLKGRLPKDYWIEKIERNVSRDKKNTELLLNKGWQVLRVWEHEIYQDLEGSIDTVIEFLSG
jgi:DNA mismatch endonuclease (patch repair protein)